MLLHHATLLLGSREEIMVKLRETLEEEGFLFTNNPDLLVFEKGVLKIDDARDLKKFASTAPVAHTFKVALLDTPLMTDETQHALLKTLEDPEGKTRFVFITRYPGALLPTLRSRLHEVRIGVMEKGEGEGTLFLKETPQERIQRVASMLDRFEKNETPEENREEARMFLRDILYALEAKGRGMYPDEKSRILESLGFLEGRAPSIKLILESAALLLPTVR